jgi:hypothetical protein
LKALSQWTAGVYSSADRRVEWGIRDSESSKTIQQQGSAMAQFTPQEDSERSRRILSGISGRTDRKPGYRVKRRDDGRTGVIVAVGGDGLSVATTYTVRWDDGETEHQVAPQILDDAFER